MKTLLTAVFILLALLGLYGTAIAADGPDLVGTSVESQKKVVRNNDAITIDYSLVNQGNTDITVTSRVQFSLVPVPGGGGFYERDLFSAVIIPALLAGESYSDTYGVHMPSSPVAPGDYYLKITVDSQDHVAETDETNNVFISGNIVRVINMPPEAEN